MDIDNYLKQTNSVFFLIILFDGHYQWAWKKGAITKIGEDVELGAFPISRRNLREEFDEAIKYANGRKWLVDIAAFPTFRIE